MNKKPPRWKIAIITWLAIYPTVSGAFWMLGWYIAHFPLLLKTLCVTLIVVPIVVFLWIPLLTKAFSKWLTAE